MIKFNIQPTLESKDYLLLPLFESDFEELFSVACDPLIWEQHPNKNRWQKEVFSIFFDGAMASKGAFKIIDKRTGLIIGSTRIYNYDADDDSIFIGYSFYAREYWGSGTNHIIKRMMLDYLFDHVSKVIFHIGVDNLRSQISIQRLGAKNVGMLEVAYYGEPNRINYVFELGKQFYVENKHDQHLATAAV